MMMLSTFLSFTDFGQRIKFLLANAYQDLCRKLNMQITPKNIQDFYLKLIIDTVAYREKNNIQRNDFLSLLIQLKNNGKFDGDDKEIGKISFTDLAAQCNLIKLKCLRAPNRYVFTYFRLRVLLGRVRNVKHCALLRSVRALD